MVIWMFFVMLQFSEVLRLLQLSIVWLSRLVFMKYVKLVMKLEWQLYVMWVENGFFLYIVMMLQLCWERFVSGVVMVFVLVIVVGVELLMQVKFDCRLKLLSGFGRKEKNCWKLVLKFWIVVGFKLWDVLIMQVMLLYVCCFEKFEMKFLIFLWKFVRQIKLDLLKQYFSERLKLVL